MKRVLAAASFLVMTMGSVAYGSDASATLRIEQSGQAAVRKFAPPFGGWTVDGKVFGLKKVLDAKGQQKAKAVLVSFFATWCAPCKAGLPHVQNIANKYKEQGLVTVLVSSGQEGAPVKEFLDGMGINLPCVADKFGSVSEKYGVVVTGDSKAESSLPRTFLLDGLGRVQAIYSIEGPDFEEALAHDLKPIFEPTPDTVPVGAN